MASRLISDLHPDLQPLAQQFLNACKAVGLNVFIDATYRDNAEQDADYVKGRTAPGEIITHARAGQSAHNCTLPDGTPAAKAFDFAILGPNGECDWVAADAHWQQAIAIGKSLGLESGADWPEPKTDSPHMELVGWDKT